ncbi:DUF3857 domain-containing protein [Salinimicrobium xinjiangense]|uniref:DUF3857 domain-containing protein n=1 Tax=Salinimicrobium xinjiangense TaxID=438596 RepID=UPI00041479AA|nr:DUF3857 domain-containing protein [Salinimicrobium xinjiangense]
MTKFLLLSFFLFPIIITAQEDLFNTKDLDVNTAELEATVYSKDSTANAFYIFEDGYSRFQSGGDYNILFDYKAKIKILNKEGFDHANIEIRLHKGKSGKEKIEDLKAVTYYMQNGRQHVRHLHPDVVYTEENPEYDLVKFTFPSVQPGAVLVYSYKKESPFIFNFQRWWFQEDIPKMYSRYIAEIPGNFKYHIKMIGHQPLDVENNDVKKRCFQFDGIAGEADCMRSEYVMKDIPAFKEEKYLTSRYNFISRIEYELKEIIRTDGAVKKFTRSWDDVDRELKTDNDLGKQLRKTKWVRGVLPEEISNKSNSPEKAREIYEYVRDNYRWNGEYQIFRNVSIKDLLEEKTGNVSAINILLHNLYVEEGFEALPFLSSTRGNGLPTQLYPVLSEFNYLMVQLELEGKKYLLDATEKNADFGITPYRSLNKYGRLLDFKNGSSWADIEPEGYSTVILHDSIKVNTDGTATGKSVHSFSGYHALAVKTRLEEIKPEEIFNSLSNPNDHTRSLSAVPNSMPNEVSIKFALHNSSQKINDLIYINPFSFKFFSENPFKLQERTYPIDFGYKDAYTYNVSLEIPENHEFVEIPENKIIALPEKGGTLHFMAQKISEHSVMIHCRVSFPFTVYSPGFYPYLQKFFSEMIELQEQSIVLVREKA